MKTHALKKLRQAALELRKFLKTGRYRTLSPERAFIEWYVLARFGRPQTNHILDGKKDGGLDAIVKTSHITFVLQAKYERSAKVSQVTRNEIAAFESLTRKFTDPELRGEFAQWRDTVRPELHAIYNDLRRVATNGNRQVRFIFVTSKRSDYGSDDLYEVEDIQNISALWYLYSEGFTPPTEHIDLTLDSSWHTSNARGGYRTYVGLADVRDFLNLMSRDASGRLFAQNVRTNLRSKVNENIRKTYEQDPELFWLGNNGIYIVCKKVSATGNVYRLTYPSVVNGSQTLHAIAESKARHSCKIIVRILEMDVLGDPVLLSAVIRRTNTQNTMKLINLFAHDTLQLNVARYLDRYKIFYERREKEWINEKRTLLTDYTPVNIKNVAQWLSTLDSRIGLGRARSQVASLFEETTYQRLFGNFDPDLRSSAYDDLKYVVWSGLLVHSTFRHMPQRSKFFAKISRLLLVKATYDAICNSASLRSSVPEMLNEHRLGRRHIPRLVISRINSIVGATVRLQRKEQRKDVNIDYSNFFKRDDLTRRAYNACCSPSAIRKLSHALETAEEQIA